MIFPLNLLLFAPCFATQLIPDDHCCGSLPTGPVLHSSSSTCHPLQEAFQSRAAGWKALLVVHVWTQQETGKKTQTTQPTSAVLVCEGRALSTPSSHLSFSRSAMDPTNLKPRACPRYALSRRKTPQFGCVVVSTQATLLSVTAHTSRISLCPLLCMNKATLEREAREVSELKIDVALASTFLHVAVWHSMKAAHVNRSTVTGVLCGP